ncbi:MAG TPA: DUF3445 domain-containing protein [Bacillales bacterium]
MPLNVNEFPFPFNGDTYRYSNNAVPLDPPVCPEVTDDYREEILLKRNLLSQNPERCFQSLPHTMEAQWEAVDLIMHELNDVYPESFRLVESGNKRILYNNLTGEEESFVFGDSQSLSDEPLNMIGRHVQEDLIIMTQRDGDLYLDAGQLCFPANWSLAFDIGMAFGDIHFPVPELSGSRLLEKIRRFIMRIEPGQPWVRKNWSLTVDHQLDTPLETSASWGKKKHAMTTENVGERTHLRVECQKLFRLPGSNSILFSIHTHLLPVEALIENKQWLRRLCSVLEELPNPVAEYKGLAPFRATLIEYLQGKMNSDQTNVVEEKN